MTVLPRLSAVMTSVTQPLRYNQRRQLLAAVGDLQRSVWLLEYDLTPADQLALLDSL